MGGVRCVLVRQGRPSVVSPMPAPGNGVDRKEPAGEDLVEDLVVVPEAGRRVDDVVGVGVRAKAPSVSAGSVVSAAPFTVCGLQMKPTSLT